MTSSLPEMGGYPSAIFAGNPPVTGNLYLTGPVSAVPGRQTLRLRYRPNRRQCFRRRIDLQTNYSFDR